MNRNTVIILVALILLGISNGWTIILYGNSVQEYNGLVERYNGLVDANNELGAKYQDFREQVFDFAENDCAAVTIVYYTNFSNNEQTLTLSVPYEKYDAYQKKNHPSWSHQNLTSVTDYITYNETIINEIVNTVRSQTQSEEEFANALLDFVQDKGHGLSIRYYPTTELKYPIETLVEMGGDCDTHAILYGTLMKAAGFKVLLLFSNEKVEGQYHVATAIHLENPPTNSLSEMADADFVYNEEKYYYAETTNWNCRVGDLPSKFEKLTFQLMPL